jgi:hypothetical protein
MEDYFVNTEEINREGIKYSTQIKLACFNKFLSAEENWEAIYDILIVISELQIEVNMFLPITDKIIDFAFQNIWKWTNMGQQVQMSQEIIIRSRRNELKQFIKDNQNEL